MAFWILISAVGLLVSFNLAGTIRLWRTSQYEPGQKWAQTALMWLLPGVAFVVFHMLSEERRRPAGRDSAVSDPGINDWIVNGPRDPPNDAGGGWPNV
jgi:hypothetical protein